MITRGLWVWKKEFVWGGATFTAELTALVGSSAVRWEMHISQSGGFQDLLWYYGESKLNGTGGNWVLLKDATDPVEAVEISWEASDDGVAKVRYTNIEVGSTSEGSYLEYGKTDDELYNLFYNAYAAESQTTVEIMWNDETKAGQVEYNNDGIFLCWDESLQNTDCPEEEV